MDRISATVPTELNPEDIEKSLSVQKGITAAASTTDQGANGGHYRHHQRGRQPKGLGIFLLVEALPLAGVQNEYSKGESGAWLPLTDNGDGAFGGGLSTSGSRATAEIAPGRTTGQMGDGGWKPYELRYPTTMGPVSNGLPGRYLFIFPEQVIISAFREASVTPIQTAFSQLQPGAAEPGPRPMPTYFR